MHSYANSDHIVLPEHGPWANSATRQGLETALVSFGCCLVRHGCSTAEQTVAGTPQ